MFVRVVDGSKEVWRARLRDGALRALTDTPERDESWPYWSDRARRLVFQVEPVGGGQSDLVLWNPDDGSESPLVNSPARSERWAGWSPSDGRLVYAFRGGRPPAGIAIADPSSGRRELAAASSPEDFFFRPSFDPTGSRLVVQRRVGPRGSQLWILAPGAPPRPLTADPRWFDMKVRFERDGKRVLFSRRPASGGPRDVMSVATDGSDLRVLASTPDSDDHSAHPSPSRDEISLVSDRNGSYDVFLAPLSGGPARALTRTPGRDEYAPHWSPDGELLAVTSSRAAADRTGRGGLEDLRIAVIDRQGRVLLETPGLMPDWMPPWP